MNFGKLFKKLRKKASIKTVSDYKMDVLIKQGENQFKKLIEKGISIPVALL